MSITTQVPRQHSPKHGGEASKKAVRWSRIIQYLLVASLSADETVAKTVAGILRYTRFIQDICSLQGDMRVSLRKEDAENSPSAGVLRSYPSAGMIREFSICRGDAPNPHSPGPVVLEC